MTCLLSVYKNRIKLFLMVLISFTFVRVRYGEIAMQTNSAYTDYLFSCSKGIPALLACIVKCS